MLKENTERGRHGEGEKEAHGSEVLYLFQSVLLPPSPECRFPELDVLRFMP